MMPPVYSYYHHSNPLSNCASDMLVNLVAVLYSSSSSPTTPTAASIESRTQAPSLPSSFSLAVFRCLFFAFVCLCRNVSVSLQVCLSGCACPFACALCPSAGVSLCLSRSLAPSLSVQDRLELLPALNLISYSLSESLSPSLSLRVSLSLSLSLSFSLLLSPSLSFSLLLSLCQLTRSLQLE